MGRLRSSASAMLLLLGSIACHTADPDRAHAVVDDEETTGAERGNDAPMPLDGRAPSETQAPPPPAPVPVPPAASALDPVARALLDAHNRARANVSPRPGVAVPPLVWDAELARFAQEYADSCPSGHRGGHPYGENLFWAGGMPVAPERAVETWADEARHYDYESTVCTRDGRANWAYCGHYTQVVWRETSRLGCGVRTDCPGQFETVVVCNYDPPGNVDATERRIPRPY